MFKRKTTSENAFDGPDSLSGSGSNKKHSRKLGKEVKQLALAAVVLEEWLQELAAIAQEQSVMQKEHAAFHFGLAASLDNGLGGEAASLSLGEGKHNANLQRANEETSVKETRS